MLDPGFTIRAWPTVTTDPADEFHAGRSLHRAIRKARKLAGNGNYRQVQIIDPYATIWASFGPIWILDRSHQ